MGEAEMTYNIKGEQRNYADYSYGLSHMRNKLSLMGLMGLTACQCKNRQGVRENVQKQKWRQI